MAYPVNIVINDRNWYDSRIAVSDPVVFQNVNYQDGDDRSVNVVRQRFMQDWARQIIPNSVRQGLGLTSFPGSGTRHRYAGLRPVTHVSAAPPLIGRMSQIKQQIVESHWFV